jgi:hypothetical protein
MESAGSQQLPVLISYSVFRPQETGLAIEICSFLSPGPEKLRHQPETRVLKLRVFRCDAPTELAQWGDDSALSRKNRYFCAPHRTCSVEAMIEIGAPRGAIIRSTEHSSEGADCPCFPGVVHNRRPTERSSEETGRNFKTCERGRMPRSSVARVGLVFALQTIRTGHARVPRVA